MNLEAFKTAVTSKTARHILTLQKHSPTILFAGGVVGVVATAVLASKATLELEDILDESEKTRELIKTTDHPEYGDEDRKRDELLLMAQTAGRVVKLYSPAIAVGVASVAALTGSHVILTKRNASLVAAYSALDKGFKEYRARVVNEYGADKDFEFRHGIAPEKLEKSKDDDGNDILEFDSEQLAMPSIYARFFDETCSQWSRSPEYNQTFLYLQQQYANNRLQARGHLFLNEVYDALGIPRTKEGAVVGWVKNGDGDNFVDFGVFNHDNARGRMFVNRLERSILLDFNVDGVIYDKI